MAALLNTQEQSLLRGWINRLGWPIAPGLGWLNWRTPALATLPTKTATVGNIGFRVLGKGSKQREVLLPPERVEELKRNALEGDASWGVPDAPAPIIGKFRKTAVLEASDFPISKIL